MNGKLAVVSNEYPAKALAAALGLALGMVTFSAAAGDSTTQSAGYEVQAINELSVSGNPETLVISTATAGSAPDSVSDNSTTYAITTNETNRKITAAIDTAMPDGLTLTVSLAAPTGASSAGAVTLGTAALEVVTAVSTLNESGLGITYGLSATSAAGVVASAAKTVTFTIVDGGA